ncbi:uncharacterized protein [Nicotiana tomentosiformis]|uniref:uncharacterized protein n=1 Tax=Nicotiana tomentosiformis TaxID=4098 RepID=UPI00388C6EC8
MVRTRSTRQEGQPPVPPASAAIGLGRGRGRGMGRGAARTAAGEVPADPPVIPNQDQVPVVDAPTQAPPMPIMVRTRATGQEVQPPVPPAKATRGQVRGRGRGRGRGAARTATGVVPVDPPVSLYLDQIPVVDAPAQAPHVPIVIPDLQEAQAQILTAYTGLAQVVQGVQTPGAPPAQPVVATQDFVVPAMPGDDQHRLERFGRLHPPPFSGTEREDAQDFLDKCQRILHTAGIRETYGVPFTTFQFSRAPLRCWETYERRRPIGAAPLTWQQWRKYPHRHGGLSQQSSQPSTLAPVTSPPAQSARGGGQSARDRPRKGGISWGGQARFYAFPARPDVIASDVVVTDYHAKTVTLAMPGFLRVELSGFVDFVPSRVISYLKAQRMVEKGCLSYLAFVRDASVEAPTIDFFPIVRDFPYVFPADLSVMPPDRDINFGIDLVLGTQPIPIPPYRMAPAELNELKEKLQELFNKGFIRSSVPPWVHRFYL